MKGVRKQVDTGEDAVVLSEGLGALVEEELGEKEEVGGGVGEVVDVDEVPGFGDGGAEGAFVGDKGEGWSGVDDVREFGDEEGDSEEEQRRLRWLNVVEKEEQRRASQ